MGSGDGDGEANPGPGPDLLNGHLIKRNDNIIVTIYIKETRKKYISTSLSIKIVIIYLSHRQLSK